MVFVSLAEKCGRTLVKNRICNGRREAWYVHYALPWVLSCCIEPQPPVPPQTLLHGTDLALFSYPASRFNVSCEPYANVLTCVITRNEGVAAKVGPHDPHGRGSHLICVYVHNSFDMDEVKRVLHALQGMGIFPSSFKPDAYTLLDINGGNKWGLSATIYRSKDKMFGGSGRSGAGKALAKKSRSKDDFFG